MLNVISRLSILTNFKPWCRRFLRQDYLPRTLLHHIQLPHTPLHHIIWIIKLLYNLYFTICVNISLDIGLKRIVKDWAEVFVFLFLVFFSGKFTLLFLLYKSARHFLWQWTRYATLYVLSYLKLIQHSWKILRRKSKKKTLLSYIRNVRYMHKNREKSWKIKKWIKNDLFSLKPDEKLQTRNIRNRGHCCIPHLNTFTVNQ